MILDISRLISRVRYSTPSGVDRVEMAYARGLLTRYGDELAFAAVHPSGFYGHVKRAAALAYLDELDRRWSSQEGAQRQHSLLSVVPWLARLLPSRAAQPSPRTVYVQASPSHLTRSAEMRGILKREEARFLCLVHDLIPIEFPEYARPSGAGQHRRRIRTITELADGIIVYSDATLRSLRPWLESSGRHVNVHTALLGTNTFTPDPTSHLTDRRPYFVCLGTIEPRKNHLLLLNLWRHMAEVLPRREVPRLLVIGRRGWENEQVIDMLERCPALKDHVEELGGCPDGRVAALVRDACALLMPTFAEGYGLPVAEALATGTPVICSDLPVLREVGGDTPDYFDPLDGPGWKAAILDFANHGPLRAAQMARLPGWHHPTWDEHINTVVEGIELLREAER